MANFGGFGGGQNVWSGKKPSGMGGGNVDDWKKLETGAVGSGKDPGWMGVGQFQAGQYGYNAEPFNDTTQSDLRRKQFTQQLAQVNQRQAPKASAATIDQSQQAQFRNAQSDLLGQLQAQAAGQGPSLAQSQLRQATDRNIQQQMAMAASGRGRNAGQGMRAAQLGAANANQQAAQQAADLRMQEQMQARQQLAGVADNARSQDLSLAQNQASLQQQAALANQQAQLTSQGQKDAMSQFYNQNLTGLDQYDTNRQMALEQLRGQQFSNAQDTQYKGYESAANRRAGFMSGVMESASSMMSDETQKTDIQGGKSALRDVLDQLSSSMKSEPNQSAGNPDNELQRLVTQSGPQMSSEPPKAATPEPEVKPAVDSSGPYVAQTPKGGGDISSGMTQKSAGYNTSEAIKKAVMLAVSDRNEKVNVTPLQENSGGVSSGSVFTTKVGKGGGGGGMGSMMGGGGEGGGGFDISKLSELFSGAGEGASVAASDKNMKKNIEQPGDQRLERFVDALKAYEYNYKNPEAPGAGEGKFISPMAQDIEKTEIGKGMVEDTPQGKMVNYGKAGGLMLATAAMLNDRLNEIESQMAGVWKKKQQKAG